MDEVRRRVEARLGLEIRTVVDWSDASLGDPALDFVCLLHGTSEAFASGLFAA
jgi:aminoglycoside phosphotransferase (APT) family kinase protein